MHRRGSPTQSACCTARLSTAAHPAAHTKAQAAPLQTAAASPSSHVRPMVQQLEDLVGVLLHPVLDVPAPVPPSRRGGRERAARQSTAQYWVTRPLVAWQRWQQPARTAGNTLPRRAGAQGSGGRASRAARRSLAARDRPHILPPFLFCSRERAGGPTRWEGRIGAASRAQHKRLRTSPTTALAPRSNACMAPYSAICPVWGPQYTVQPPTLGPSRESA